MFPSGVTWFGSTLRLTVGMNRLAGDPAVVLSPLIYNRKTQLMLCCPITSRVKGYPFEVSVSARTISGVILADQIKSVDWVARHARYAGKVNPETVHAVLD